MTLDYDKVKEWLCNDTEIAKLRVTNSNADWRKRVLMKLEKLSTTPQDDYNANTCQFPRCNSQATEFLQTRPYCKMHFDHLFVETNKKGTTMKFDYGSSS